MAPVNQVFQSAPMGRRVIAPLVISIVVVVVAVVFNVEFIVRALPLHTPLLTKALGSLAPLMALVIMVPVFIFERSRTSHFRIEENVLVLGRKRFPMVGLLSIERDPEVLRRAIRVFGNGGLGSIRGFFWSKRMGKFYAFLTGTDHAVVLRWPGNVVAVSPSDTEFFIYTAKSAAGLK